MSAIITDILKKQLTQTVFDEATGVSLRTTDTPHNYYVGIGRSEEWNATETVPAPTDTPSTIRDATSRMQSIKKVEGTSYVIPRFNWTSGTVYTAFNDNVSAIPSNSYYVLTEENHVYICLQQGKDAAGVPLESVVKPAIVDLTKPFKTADGYKWKFLYSISAARAVKFLSSNFVPIQNILATRHDSAGIDINSAQQKQVDSAAVPGQILGVELTHKGTGYSSAPAISIVGNGVRADATAFVSGGEVVKIEMDSTADSCLQMGQGYTYASVTIGAPNTGTDQAKARVIIGPKEGIGNDPRDELKSTSLMFNVKPDGDVEAGSISSKTFLLSKFRQVALIKNPLASDSAAPGSFFVANSGMLLENLFIASSSQANSFTVNTIVTGAGGAKAVIDKVDTTAGFVPRLVVHQSEDSTGFLPFTNGEAITGPGGGTATLDSAGVSEVNKASGDLLYIENRAPVERSNAQSEDIKVVITL